MVLQRPTVQGYLLDTPFYRAQQSGTGPSSPVTESDHTGRLPTTHRAHRRTTLDPAPTPYRPRTTSVPHCTVPAPLGIVPYGTVPVPPDLTPYHPLTVRSHTHRPRTTQSHTGPAPTDPRLGIRAWK